MKDVVEYYHLISTMISMKMHFRRGSSSEIISAKMYFRSCSSGVSLEQHARGLTALEQAISVLKDFYSSPGWAAQPSELSSKGRGRWVKI